MTNPPRQKGTRAETAIVRYAQTVGFPWADRQPLRGTRDQADITLCPGVVIEAKAHKTAGTGQPPPGLLARWLDELDAAAARADGSLGLLVVKRAGSTNVGTWWCYLRPWDFTAAFDAWPFPDDVAWMVPSGEAWVCLPFSVMLQLMRVHGYGAPVEDPAGVAS